MTVNIVEGKNELNVGLVPVPAQVAGLLGGQTAYGSPPYERPEFWIFYEGLSDYQKMLGDNWSLPTPVMSRFDRTILTWAVNKSTVAADFQIVLQARYSIPGFTQEFKSDVITLSPGDRGRFTISFVTFGSGVKFRGSDGQYHYISETNPWVFQLYADGVLVDQVQRTITTF